MLTEERLKAYVHTGQFRAALEIPAGKEPEVVFLAQGEYHRNYRFRHPVSGRDLVLRINCGSQMHLEHQIMYEYNTLQLLKISGRTPAPLFADEIGIDGHGVLVMEFLEGRPLDYGKDLKEAAACLADIHSVPVPPDSHLIRSGNTALDIIAECGQMFRIYQESELADPVKTERVLALLERGRKTAQNPVLEGYAPCCINTELNNTNFLTDSRTGRVRLIDWEKPLYGDPAQDLAHFLAPSTTFWKTDVILDCRRMEFFTEAYIQACGRRLSEAEQKSLKERVRLLIPVTCLRGITWCAMAWIEYQNPGRMLRNSSTFRKLEKYLNDDFLQMAEEQLHALHGRQPIT